MIERLDSFLDNEMDAPSAITMVEHYDSVHTLPVGGQDLPHVFPPTFVGPRNGDGKSVYNIDRIDERRNVCILDTVGSQANRMETMFGRRPLAGLVPQVEIDVPEAAGGQDLTLNLVDVDQRVADTLVRHTELVVEVDECFHAYQYSGDASPMAKLSPMSLLFGVWDSRGTHIKIPRILESTMFATDVLPLTRRAQYNTPVNYKQMDLVAEDTEMMANLGFAPSPADGLGGVLVQGEIVRNVTINLIALRAIRAGAEHETTVLRRYILGLALAALTVNIAHLRQGTLLKLASGSQPTMRFHWHDGTTEDAQIAPNYASFKKIALAYAERAAEEFGVGPTRRVTFDIKKAKETIKGGRKGRGKGAADVKEEDS